MLTATIATRRGFLQFDVFQHSHRACAPSKSDQPPPRRGHPHSQQPAVSWFIHLQSARFLFLQVALEPKSKLLAGASGPGSSCRTWLAACVWERLALRLSWTCQAGLHWRPLKLHVIWPRQTEGSGSERLIFGIHQPWACSGSACSTGHSHLGVGRAAIPFPECPPWKFGGAGNC